MSICSSIFCLRTMSWNLNNQVSLLYQMPNHDICLHCWLLLLLTLQAFENGLERPSGIQHVHFTKKETEAQRGKKLSAQSHISSYGRIGASTHIFPPPFFGS